MGRARSERPSGLAGQLGARIEGLRKKRGWTAAELGQASALGLGTVIRIEGGRVSPTLDTVLALARAFGVSGRELLKGCRDWEAKTKED